MSAESASHGGMGKPYHASLIRPLLALKEDSIARMAFCALFRIRVWELHDTHLSAHDAAQTATGDQAKTQCMTSPPLASRHDIPRPAPDKVRSLCSASTCSCSFRGSSTAAGSSVSSTTPLSLG